MADGQAQTGNVKKTHIVVSPLFIGPSDSVAEFMPNQLRTVAQEHPDSAQLLRLELAPPLVCLCPFVEKSLPLSRRGEGRIAAILHERVREVLASATPTQRGNGTFWMPIRTFRVVPVYKQHAACCVKFLAVL